jgi:two-component system, OmpR family, sensor histidine kinase KdpD
MNQEIRPNPDELLRQIKHEESIKNRGKFKIFFGMCAGVGKTYAMLEAAHIVKKDGKDVVIGYVETHKRKDTESLTLDLEIIPRKKIEYRGTEFEEMDIDAILQRKPAIVLVDELAHTNISGSRHLKRYQDVIEILESGIDVYTTVNVQHIESRSITVNEITGIAIQEKVPDSVFDLATDIELVDISPDDLLKRLAEGKVYIPEKTAQATQNFFRKGNLHALRELALRITAEKVDSELINYKRNKNIGEVWKTTEKLLVAVGPGPYSAKLIQWTRRMAFNLGAQWFVVNVETGLLLSENERINLNKNIQLAQRLGAIVINIENTDVVAGVLQVAYENNVNQIIIGKSLYRNRLKLLWSKNISNRILNESGNIDVYVIKADKSVTSDKKGKFRFRFVSSSLNDYLIALGAVGILTLICFPFTHFIGYQTIGLIYLLSIAILSLFLGRSAVIFTAGINSIIWNFFFIPPVFTFHVARFDDLITLIANFIIALVMSILITRIKKYHTVLTINQRHSVIINSLLENLNKATSIKEVVAITRRELQHNFNADAVVYLQNKGGHDLTTRAFGNSELNSVKDFSVAVWAFNNKKTAGKFTETLSDANLQFIPLTTIYGVWGVIGVKFLDNKAPLFEIQRILNTLYMQVALSIEREINNDKRVESAQNN